VNKVITNWFKSRTSALQCEISRLRTRERAVKVVEEKIAKGEYLIGQGPSAKLPGEVGRSWTTDGRLEILVTGKGCVA
jgi:hypothetical protein